MKATVKDVVVGKTLFKVWGLGKGSFMEAMEITSEPYEHEFSDGTTSIFAKYKFTSVFNPSESWDEKFSLQDANIVPNTYNDHETFTDIHQAKRYLAHCKNGGTRKQFHMANENILKGWGRA